MEQVLSPDLQARYQNITFQGKRTNEDVVLLLRRHWLILVFKLIPLFFYLLILLVFNFVGPQIFQMAQINLPDKVISLMESFLWMFFWIILFVVWVDYYLDVWIVTTERIINIEQLGLFQRDISELEHSKIQDVTSEVEGVIPTLFNFGYIYIQTAGEVERFVFKQVPDPVKTRNVIMQLQQWELLQQKREEGQILRGKL